VDLATADPSTATMTDLLERDRRGGVSRHTGDMLLNLYEQVAYLSGAFTQEVGDVLSTGTPSGIAWHRPGRYLKAGDAVRIEIEKIGTLENPVLDEPRDPCPRPSRSAHCHVGGERGGRSTPGVGGWGRCGRVSVQL
jgi:hypothetical protein